LEDTKEKLSEFKAMAKQFKEDEVLLRDSLTQKDSMILGLNRQIDAMKTDKIAVLKYSKTGHHEVELAGLWVPGDFAAISRMLARAIRAQPARSKTEEAAQGLAQRIEAVTPVEDPAGGSVLKGAEKPVRIEHKEKRNAG